MAKHRVHFDLIPIYLLDRHKLNVRSICIGMENVNEVRFIIKTIAKIINNQFLYLLSKYLHPFNKKIEMFRIILSFSTLLFYSYQLCISKTDLAELN